MITQKLSALINEIESTIHQRFSTKTFWIKAEITDVKKHADKRWCFLKFIEKEGNTITSEIKGVFWSTTYYHVENFERETGQAFASGIEITCNVRVRFHRRFGLDLEVLAIDFSYVIGKMELERKQTLERLIRENPGIISLDNGSFSTGNNRLPLPTVYQRIALITAPNSDGQRDFNHVIQKNKYGYAFYIQEFLTQVQGDAAPALILRQLQNILMNREKFDIVVIVRGGGSDTDFRTFNDYDLAAYIALFPVPILTGIGHDRNTSIADLMARQLKTPTETASFILDSNLSFEKDLMKLKDRFFAGIKNIIELASKKLAYNSRIVRSCSPQTIMSKGFAILMHGDRILTDPAAIEVNDELKAVLKDQVLYSTVHKKEINGNKFEF